MPLLVSKFSFAFFIFLGLPPLAVAGTITYFISTSLDKPESANIYADTSSLSSFLIEKPRSVLPGDENAPEITCMTPSGNFVIEYGKKVSCKEIQWTTTFSLIPEAGINVSSQKNLFSSTSGWWVLFEWNNLPRIKENHAIKVCADGGDGVGDSLVCRKLPGPDEPPLIMPWGNYNVQEKNQDLEFTLFSDVAQRALSLQSRALFIAQYRYLRKLFSLPPHSGNQLDLILVGIDAGKGSIGGAAGSQAFIANYPEYPEGRAEESTSRTHWVAGHEMFHIISPHEFPLWISESLAQYYGYKSQVVVGGTTTINPLEMWAKDAAQLPHASSGLYQAHKMVSGKQDMSYYPLLYIKGAAFWQNLDVLLQTQGRSLDEFLSKLTSADLSSGELPDSFAKSVLGIIGGDRYKKLVSQYM